MWDGARLELSSLVEYSSQMRRGLRLPANACSMVSSPLGEVFVACSEAGLCYLGFSYGWQPVVASERYRPEDFVRPDENAMAAAVAWLEAYFRGSSAVPEPRLDLRGSPFELRVWAAVREIPWGSTKTYGEVAARLGDASLSRAVGAALSQNRVCLVVPCHRVIGVNGKLAGYAGGLERKRRLLEMEGALEPLLPNIVMEGSWSVIGPQQLSGAIRRAAKVE